MHTSPRHSTPRRLPRPPCCNCSPRAPAFDDELLDWHSGAAGGAPFRDPISRRARGGFFADGAAQRRGGRDHDGRRAQPNPFHDVAETHVRGAQRGADVEGGATVDPGDAVAQGLYGLHIVSDKQGRNPILSEPLHSFLALCLKRFITHRK